MDPIQRETAARHVAELRYTWGGRVALYCLVHAFVPPATTREQAELNRQPHVGVDALEDTSPTWRAIALSPSFVHIP